MKPEDESILAIRDYYTAKIEQHGATPLGVDWRDATSQEARFGQIELLMTGDSAGSLADIGCGYGSLALYLRRRGWLGFYEGVDISEPMIEAAREFLKGETNVHLTVGGLPTEPSDYVVASGIFNVKMTADTTLWEKHVYRTIDAMVLSARKGVAFNCLTSWSDKPLMRDDLFYAAPERILEYCAARHSRWIEVSQDYGLFEFTVRMRFDRRANRLRVGM